MRRITALALLVLGLDFATKALVGRLLPLPHPPVSILGDWVRFTHVRNYGSAFGLIQGGRLFFTAFSILSIALILALARKPRYRMGAFGISLGLILGGAFGNLIDRVVAGAVTDFIDVGIGGRRWPTFNVADMGVTIGVCLMALILLREPHRGRSEEAGAGPSPDADEADLPVSSESPEPTSTIGSGAPDSR